MSVVVAGPDARLVEGLLERLALLEDENAALREREQALEAERERLRGEVERRRVENDRLRGESERLRARNERLREEIQALRRAAKRQAAPCSKGDPKPDPKRAGAADVLAAIGSRQDVSTGCAGGAASGVPGRRR